MAGGWGKEGRMDPPHDSFAVPVSLSSSNGQPGSRDTGTPRPCRGAPSAPSNFGQQDAATRRRGGEALERSPVPLYCLRCTNSLGFGASLPTHRPLLLQMGRRAGNATGKPRTATRWQQVRFRRSRRRDDPCTCRCHHHKPCGPFTVRCPLIAHLRLPIYTLQGHKTSLRRRLK